MRSFAMCPQCHLSILGHLIEDITHNLTPVSIAAPLYLIDKNGRVAAEGEEALQICCSRLKGKRLPLKG